MMQREKIVGILGGMGPEATVDFFKRIVKLTPARSDQEHIHIIIDNNPKIPDRTQAILHRGESPLPFLKETAKNLERAGVDFIVIPCNTAHYYYEEIQKSVNIPIIHLIKEVVKKVLLIKEDPKAVGLLATTGTIKTNLYQSELKQKNVRIILPDKNKQNKVTNSIMEIKSRIELGKNKENLIQIAKGLIKQQAEIIIIGCTEISMLVKEDDLEVPIVDSLQVLAEKTVLIIHENRKE